MKERELKTLKVRKKRTERKLGRRLAVVKSFRHWRLEMMSGWWSGPVPTLNRSQNFYQTTCGRPLAQYLYSRFVRGFLSLCKITDLPFLFSLQENRPFSVNFFRKMIQFEKEQVSVLSVHFSLGKWISTYSSMAAFCCLRSSHHNTV